MWNLNNNSFVDADPVGSMSDRARDYDALLRVHNMPHGAVTNTLYNDLEFTSVQKFDGIGDSALWTGTALAAESWRYRATGSPDAAERIRFIAATVHRALNVSGAPGYLARYVMPSNSTLPVDVDCANPLSAHCNVEWNGELWNWRGTTSRDQYTGVLLGMMAAYDATPDADVRTTIRSDVVEIARQLMMSRPATPVRVIFNGNEFDTTMDFENVIPAPMEMIDGRVKIQIDTGNFGESRLDGVREFMPDMGPALRQLPLLGWLPAVPRRGSAIMMGGIFAMAIHMTEGPEFSDIHNELRNYFESHAEEWFSIANGWNDEANDCGGGYYANHITLILAYSYAQTESDSFRLNRFRTNVLTTMRDAFAAHKNVYFDFLLEGSESSPQREDVTDGVAQLSQFEAGPRVFAPRNNLESYPHDNECSENGQPLSTADIAVDVGSRVIDDFIWQRNPWVLYADGNPYQIFPGVDYLAAYWAGRRHGFIDDDKPGHCARWDAP